MVARHENDDELGDLLRNFVFLMKLLKNSYQLSNKSIWLLSIYMRSVFFAWDKFYTFSLGFSFKRSQYMREYLQIIGQY